MWLYVKQRHYGIGYRCGNDNKFIKVVEDSNPFLVALLQGCTIVRLSPHRCTCEFASQEGFLGGTWCGFNFKEMLLNNEPIQRGNGACFLYFQLGIPRSRSVTCNRSFTCGGRGRI